MASKIKIRQINIVDEGGAFLTFFKKFSTEKIEFDFEGLSALRKLLSNERARLLYVLKTKNPPSLYFLAKTLGRNFKSVSEDIKLLERFGFIEMIAEKTGNRKRLRPILSTSKVQINIKI
jgi:predicted transcriptional regulator